MPYPEDENDLQDYLKSEYQERLSDAKEVHTRVNLGTLNIKGHMQEWFGADAFVSSEIDLLIIYEDKKIEAIETKYFDENDGTIRPHFYDGIGQAIGLSYLGVDYVSLQHYFVPEIDEKDMVDYGGLVRKLTEIHGLPFRYETFRLNEDSIKQFEEGAWFHPKIVRQPSKETGEYLSGGSSTVRWGHEDWDERGRPNPLLEKDEPDNDVLRARDFILKEFDVPRVD